MQIPYSRLRYGLVAAAALLALPATAQEVVTDITPTSEALRSSDARPAAPTDRATRDAAKARARRATGTLTAPVKDGPLAALDGTLRNLAENGARTRSGARAGSETVMIQALATDRGAVSSLRAALQKFGFELVNQAGASLTGRVPISALEAVAKIPSLRSAMALHAIRHGADGADTYVSPVSTSNARVGAVTGEASQALRADIARSRFGVTGDGVCIGMLSDSYNNLGGAAAGVASGDLPGDVLVLDDLDGGGSDEGRAMMELAYDVAPGTDLAFHTAFTGFASFSGGIVDLFQAGCTVIVDDIGYAGDPFFQDGVIAQAVDYVVSQGASYFSSAGNSADASYESDFRDSGDPGFFIGSVLHDFDPGPGTDSFQDILIFPGETLRFAFQYDEPSILASTEFSEFPELYGGDPNQAPTSDYDVFLFDGPSVDAGILAASVELNPLDGTPFEFIEYTNFSGDIQVVYLSIEKFDGEDRRLKYINFGGDDIVIRFAEYVEPGTSTTFGHSNAAGAFATGAGAWFNTPTYSAFVDGIESVIGPSIVNGFSSYGGLDIRLDVDGNRLASPVDRMKPDAVASDGDNNTFFGFDTAADADSNPNFFGTSASAPNAAAVAALAIEAVGGVASPETIYAALEETAADLLPGFPINRAFNVGSGPGFDDQSGNGFIRADFALASLLGIEPAECSQDLALSFDLDGNGTVNEADFEADGIDDTGLLGTRFGELVGISNDTAGEIVDLSGCSFIVFNPFTERVTYVAETDGVIGAREELVLAGQNGDQALPAGTLPDGPGAFALVTGDVAVGARVRDVLDSVVASVVYFSDRNVFGSRSGGGASARTATSAGEWLADALAEVRGDVLASGSVDLTLTAAPNPVRGRLAVAFGAAEPAPVRASVFDVLGREVAVLADGPVEAGRHEVGLDTAAMPSGVYIVRVTVGDDVQTTQVTVVR